MITLRKRISKEVYDRATQDYGGVICQEDRQTVFTDAELYGYGVYGARVIEVGGEYSCEYQRGESCD